MSIQTNLYHMFYEGYEKQQQRVIDLRAEHRLKKVKKIERKHKRHAKAEKIVEYGLFAGSIVMAGMGYQEITDGNTSAANFPLTTGATLIAPLLGVHFHYSSKLEKLANKKIMGEQPGDI